MATTVHPEAAPHAHPTYHEVTRDIAATLGNPSRSYFLLLGVVLTVLGAGALALLYQIRWGLGVAGYTPP
ncbi:MAG: hypothetical protein OEW06_13265, partial [Gemmatimonadota bacterium]|nr:hypothetical protein [Gemmatimonadota bacterium]